MCDGSEGNKFDSNTNEKITPKRLAAGLATGLAATVVIFLIFGAILWVIGKDYEQGWERRNSWEQFAQRNPQIEIIAVQQGQYGLPKFNASQLIVEVRGTKTGETRMIREKDDRVKFNHLPQKGETWHCWVESAPGRGSYFFTFCMEPVYRGK